MTTKEDLLKLLEYPEEWEVLLDAMAAGRLMTAQELAIAGKAVVTVALRRGLVDQEAGRERLKEIADDQRESQW